MQQQEWGQQCCLKHLRQARSLLLVADRCCCRGTAAWCAFHGAVQQQSECILARQDEDTSTSGQSLAHDWAFRASAAVRGDRMSGDAHKPLLRRLGPFTSAAITFSSMRAAAQGRATPGELADEIEAKRHRRDPFGERYVALVTSEFGGTAQVRTQEQRPRRPSGGSAAVPMPNCPTILMLRCHCDAGWRARSRGGGHHQCARAGGGERGSAARALLSRRRPALPQRPAYICLPPAAVALLILPIAADPQHEERVGEADAGGGQAQHPGGCAAHPPSPGHSWPAGSGGGSSSS